MTPRPRRSQAERVGESTQRLLDAAAELVAEQGYRRTTAAQIAERAGFSRELVRVRFGSKEGLVDQLLRSSYEEPLLVPPTRADTGLAALLASLDQLDEMATQRPVLLRAVFSLQLDAATSAPELRPLVERWLDGMRRGLEASIRRGVRDGSLRADVSPAAAARRLSALSIGTAYQFVLSAGETHPTRVMREAVAELTA